MTLNTIQLTESQKPDLSINYIADKYLPSFSDSGICSRPHMTVGNPITALLLGQSQFVPRCNHMKTYRSSCVRIFRDVITHPTCHRFWTDITWSKDRICCLSPASSLPQRLCNPVLHRAIFIPVELKQFIPHLFMKPTLQGHCLEQFQVGLNALFKPEEENECNWRVHISHKLFKK